MWLVEWDGRSVLAGECVCILYIITVFNNMSIYFFLKYIYTPRQFNMIPQSVAISKKERKQTPFFPSVSLFSVPIT